MIFLPPTQRPNFPSPELADGEGFLAFGGLLNSNWLIEAYSRGIFPWFSEENPIMWWSPNPRAIMNPQNVKIQKSMKSYFNQNKYELRIDTAFEEVIDFCSKIPRKEQGGTWITKSMIEAYIKLHYEGYAHSFETWKDGELVGGLYGISLGKMFFGESMFSVKVNASKFAFISMCKILSKNNFNFIDCQIPTKHLKTLGCGEVSRKKFLEIIEDNRKYITKKGNWNNI